MTLPTFVSVNAASTTYGSQVAPAITGVQAGDLIICTASCDYSRDWNTPAGYTKVYADNKVTNHLSQLCAYKTADGTETSVTMSITAGNEPIAGHSIVITGWNGSVPTATLSTGNSAAQTCPDATALADCLVLRLMSLSNGSGITVDTKPGTEILTTAAGTGASDVTISNRYTTKTGAGAVGTAAFATSGASQWVTATVLIHGPGGALANITSSPATVKSGDTAQAITGTNFDATEGVLKLVNGADDNTLTTSAWSDTGITFDVGDFYAGELPFGTHQLTVIPDTSAQNFANIAVTPEDNWDYVTLTSVYPTTDNRFTATPDIEIGWQIAYDTRLYAADGTTALPAYPVEVLPDGTFTIAGLPPDNTYKIKARLFNATTNAWGSVVNQTITTDIEPPEPGQNNEVKEVKTSCSNRYPMRVEVV